MTDRIPMLTLAATLVLASFAAPADACEMCPTDYEITAVEAAAKATLVAIVSRADEQPPQPEGLPANEPDTIALDVHEVLEGEAEATIVANSWDGMCDYGVVIEAGDENRYLVMLEKRGDAWRQVHQGCAPYQLVVEDGAVAIPKGKGKYHDENADRVIVPVAELAAALGLEGRSGE